MDNHNSTDTSATAQRAVASGPLVLLRWRAHPTEANVLQGYRPSQPGTTLFRIELHPTKPHRGWLFGAFIPDSHERTDWTFGLVVALKVNAESYMREWVEEYNKQNTKVTHGRAQP